ncbi:hypothetical protein BD410DRAFT_792130 [Rickenella mellea]|uniref:Uncharacterized protein n=1 Tax=Rickenella mellea TaxID=50990 RepID=A0A4Y7PX91_9AGAM|nr:hypothetical protein BD410DRAFT_792130 [Rickenella mellea]
MERSPSHQTSEGASQLVIEPSASLEPSSPDQPSINDLKSEITWLGIFVSELQGINCKLESTIKDMEIEREKQLELREQERGAAAAEARSVGATHAAALARLTNEVETGQVAQV